ncbi:hypothetical protein AHAT_26170 [Agarivorans sp. Toyoura001]|nr:hypothetical protein AHAT_26170 [Agarivorans sp. Toyoura001]
MIGTDDSNFCFLSIEVQGHVARLPLIAFRRMGCCSAGNFILFWVGFLSSLRPVGVFGLVEEDDEQTRGTNGACGNITTSLTTQSAPGLSLQAIPQVRQSFFKAKLLKIMGLVGIVKCGGAK